MSIESGLAAELLQRYQDLAVVDPGSGAVVHDGLCEGAFSDFFDPNTGGHVWVSHTLHRVGDLVLHVSAGSDSVGVYRSLHGASAEMASCALYALCGEDRHLLIAEGDYTFPKNVSERPAAMAAILSRFRQRHGLPDLAPEQLLKTCEDAKVRAWLGSFLQEREALCGSVSPTVTRTESVRVLNRYEAGHVAGLCHGYYFPRPEELAASNGMISQAAFERARAEAIKNVKTTVANLDVLTFEQYAALSHSGPGIISRHGEIPPTLTDKLAAALRLTRDSLVGWMEVQDEDEAREYDDEALAAADGALAEYDGFSPPACADAEDEPESPRP